MTQPQRFEAKAWLLITLSCIAVYAVWPALDLQVASWFYTPSVGFKAEQWPWIEVWHMTVPWVGRTMLIGSLLLLVFGQRLMTPRIRRQVSGLAIGLFIGLWLILHVGFKDNWGRARPEQITELGGTKAYTSPLVPSSGCDRNCSFMSGHAGTGFVLMSAGALATTRTRRRWLLVGWVAGLTLGWIRMAQGGHFLGDVVFGGLLLWGCAWVTRWHYVHWRGWRRRKAQH